MTPAAQGDGGWEGEETGGGAVARAARGAPAACRLPGPAWRCGLGLPRRGARAAHPWRGSAARWTPWCGWTPPPPSRCSGRAPRSSRTARRPCRSPAPGARCACPRTNRTAARCWGGLRRRGQAAALGRRRGAGGHAQAQQPGAAAAAARAASLAPRRAGALTCQVEHDLHLAPHVIHVLLRRHLALGDGLDGHLVGGWVGGWVGECVWAWRGRSGGRAVWRGRRGAQHGAGSWAQGCCQAAASPAPAPRRLRPLQPAASGGLHPSSPALLGGARGGRSTGAGAGPAPHLLAGLLLGGQAGDAELAAAQLLAHLVQGVHVGRGLGQHPALASRRLRGRGGGRSQGGSHAGAGGPLYSAAGAARRARPPGGGGPAVPDGAPRPARWPRLLSSTGRRCADAAAWMPPRSGAGRSRTVLLVQGCRGALAPGARRRGVGMRGNPAAGAAAQPRPRRIRLCTTQRPDLRRARGRQRARRIIRPFGHHAVPAHLGRGCPRARGGPGLLLVHDIGLAGRAAHRGGRVGGMRGSGLGREALRSGCVGRRSSRCCVPPSHGRARSGILVQPSHSAGRGGAPRRGHLRRAARPAELPQPPRPAVAQPSIEKAGAAPHPGHQRRASRPPPAARRAGARSSAIREPLPLPLGPAPRQNPRYAAPGGRPAAPGAQ
jgi:hypothetical protein